MKERLISVAIVIWLLVVAGIFRPQAKDSELRGQIRKDMEQIYSQPENMIGPNVMHRVALPPVSSQRDEREALLYAAKTVDQTLDEANRNRARQYASPAQRPRTDCIGCHPGKPAESWIDVFGRTLKSIFGV
jgi:hypothetical protein